MPGDVVAIEVWRRTRIVVRTNIGRQRVFAERHGYLAFHKPVDRHGGYMVSHVPTGYAVARFRKQRPAQQFILKASKQFDWSFRKESEAPNITRTDIVSLKEAAERECQACTTAGAP